MNARALAVAGCFVVTACARGRTEVTADANPPHATGGGPRADQAPRISVSSAIDVLVDAHCHRSRICRRAGGDESCSAEAVEQHATLDVAHCPRGVDPNALSVCAAVLRSATCDLRDIRSPSCAPTTLCAD
jgi:hypothetical protein